MSEPRFDMHQFAGHRSFAVKATVHAEGEWDSTGISHADYQGMHNTGGVGSGKVGRNDWPAPPFAFDDKKLAEVLRHMAWRYAHGGRALPKGITLEELQRDASARCARYIEQCQRSHFTDYQKQIGEAHARAVAKAGGYMQMCAQVMWCAWRRGMNSVEVARETGISPCNVRQLLSKFNKLAQKLFPEDALPVYQRLIKARSGVKVKTGDPNGKRVMHVVAELILSGLTCEEVAQKLGCSIVNVENRCGEWEKATGLKLRGLNHTERQKARRAAWIGQGLCGVDGKDQIWAEHSKAECEKHVCHYKKLAAAYLEKKKAAVTAEQQI